MTTNTVTSYQCCLCSNTFSRQEHLDRHMLSHGSFRPFPCDFCSSSFKRGDALKRHHRKCRRRIQHMSALMGVVEISQSSRRRACDRCIQRKHACNFANPCEACARRGEPCTYRRAQGIVDPTSDEIEAITERPATHHVSYGDVEIDSTLSSGHFASTDLVATRTPNEISWDFSWPSEPTQLLPYLPTTPKGQGWEARVFPDLAAVGFTYSPSIWHSLSENQAIHNQRELLLSCTRDTLGSFNFAFLANFTSTTGFANSFDCGTLEERKLVLNSCATTDINDFCIKSFGCRENYPANVFSDEGTSEDSNAVVEADSQIWGFILPKQVPIPGTRAEYQHKAQLKPLYTKNWMQGSSEEHRTESIASMRCRGVPKDFNSDIPGCHRFMSNPLILMSHEIVSRIQEVISIKPRNSIITLTWSSLLEQICQQFFSPPNLIKYFELYWACWHPNWPVIHKPTFSLVSAHPVLVAAMTLVGACLSPDLHDNEIASTWFDSVEEMAFSDEDFCDNSGAGSTPPAASNPTKSRRKVQALQAAYAVCLYQNWEGSDRNKRRIRRHRYSTVVAVARDLGFDSAQHEAFQSQDTLVFDWLGFIVREEFIRTTIYIFLLDTAFVIFNKLPPRMVIKELKMDLACPESCFQAPTADECFAAITDWTSTRTRKRRLSLRSVIETVLGKHMDRDTRADFAELGILNLFTIASALHTLIFQCQASFSCGPRLAPLRNALENWKQVWLVRSSSKTGAEDCPADHGASRSGSDPRQMWKRIGFMRNAPEFWLLAKIVLEILEAAHRGNEVPNPFVDTVETPNDLLSLGSSASEKYDETSMGQVNDIITMFQRLNV